MTKKDLLKSVAIQAWDPAQVMLQAGLTPDEWQLQVLRTPADRIILNCCRQSGKSTVVAAMATHEALFAPGSLTLIISTKQDQSNEVMQKIKFLLSRRSDEPPLKLESLSKLEFVNGSRIICLPQNPDGVRGYTADLLILDEASRIENATIDAVLLMTMIKQGRLLVASTPNGKNNWFAETWAHRDEQKFYSVEITADQCPRITDEEKFKYRVSRGEAMFQQELMCQFLDDSFNIFDLGLLDKLLVDVPPIEWGKDNGQIY